MLLKDIVEFKVFYSHLINKLIIYDIANSNMEINRNKEQISEKELPIETVLVLQGGGSLGAYECGVYKTLVKHNIKFDIVSGTSIGALNAAIIAAHSYDTVKNSVKELEHFWLELAEILIPLPEQ